MMKTHDGYEFRETGKFMVMPTITCGSLDDKTEPSFDRNAIDIPNEAEAEAEAERRNSVERANGKLNVEWWACPMTKMFRPDGTEVTF